MKTLIKLIAISTIFIQTLSANTDNITPQANPIYNLFDSIIMQNETQLKTVFSERMVTTLEKKYGWTESLKQYTKLFKKEFGDYQMKDLSFKFEADSTNDSKGRIWTFFKGKKTENLSIILENDKWKMNER